jgi:hypothetical protein
MLILWSIWGYFSSKVEQAEYTVLSKKKYEIRVYKEHIVAQTIVKGSYKESLNEGFRIIARYIFGGNTRRESIAMTTPVLEKKSESIAMTTPVMASIEGEEHVISFGMPKKYTLETLPVPIDDRISIVVIPQKKMAVMRFGWYRTDARVQEKKKVLLDILRKEGIQTLSEPYYAGYNAPWTPPWLTRNEILIEIE